MVEANQSYHPQIVRAIIAMALYEARKEIKRNIQREGRVRLCKVPHRDIERLAKAMVMERRDEFIAKAKASGVVQDELSGNPFRKNVCAWAAEWTQFELLEISQKQNRQWLSLGFPPAFANSTTHSAIDVGDILKRRLQAKEERKRQRQLERNSKHLSNSESCGSQGLSLNECHARNGAAK